MHSRPQPTRRATLAPTMVDRSNYPGRQGVGVKRQVSLDISGEAHTSASRSHRMVHRKLVVERYNP